MEETLIGKFYEVVAAQSNASAVVAEDGTFTYGELDAWSNGIANLISPRLKSDGVNYVVLMLPRSRLFIAAALGALKAGAASVPVNPAYPADRVNSILEETRPVLFLTTPEIWSAKRGTLSVDNGTVMTTDRLAPSAVLSASAADDPDRPALVLYTSGTTGRPKGVVHTLRSLTAIAALDEPVPQRWRFALVPDFAFIVFACQLFECLWHGGEAHIIGDEMRMDLGRLAAYLNERKINRAFMGSSMGVAMLKAFELNLDELLLGGEKVVGVPSEAARKIRIRNYYGMSELCPISDTHIITGEEGAIPAGRPDAGCRVLVLDADLREVPAGTTGDVYAASDRMAASYLNLPEQSAERFIADPFVPGGRLLRTGDRGFIDPNGELVLCGRTDGLVKLNGLRIETGEIEVVAQAFPGMSGCACALREVSGNDRLCLYFENDEPVSEEQLREHLARKLAPYMIPSFFRQLDRLPRNARGKIDRKALPAPVGGVPVERVPAESDNEQMLLDVIAGILGTSDFGVTDDVFSLGLTSLMAMKAVVEAGKVGIRINSTGLMKYKTVRATLQHGTHIVEWYDGYDPKKDVMVFANGISLTKNVERKLRMWAKHCNVLTIEPVQEHYRYIFEGDDTKEIVEFYTALVDWYVPKGAKIRACSGVSWGGKIAYLVACRWHDLTGQTPTVVLGDAILNMIPDMIDSLLRGRFLEWLDSRGIDSRRFNTDFVRRQTILAKIEHLGVTMPHYDGPVVLLHARVLTINPPDNDKAWAELCPNLTVVPVNAGHTPIAMDTEATLPVWEKVIEEVSAATPPRS